MSMYACEFLPKIKPSMQAYTEQEKKYFVIIQMTVLFKTN